MKKVLICEVNTFLGQRVCERFEKTHEWDVIGTRRPFVSSDCQGGDADTIPGLKEWIPGYLEDAVEFKRRVLDSDVVICPLTDNSQEAFAAIRMLSNTSFDTEKTFVLVSSVQTWADTHLSEKTIAEAEKQAERQALIAAGEEVPDEEPEAEPEELPVFTEDQYQRRVPSRRYDHWKELEKFTKHVNSETLHTYVLFAGLPYGHGEQAFHPLFRAAWHARPVPLYTSGSNFVPLIHIDDLATIVYKVGASYDVLPQRYMLAVDKGNHTLSQIVGAINDRLGTGKTVPVPSSKHHTVPLIEHFTVDLKMEPGSVYELLDEEEWVAPDGFVAASEKVAAEFLKYRQITPVRMIVVGPPLAGKSTVAEKIAAEYRLPHLKVPTVIEDFKENLAELKQTIKDRRQARREQKRLLALEEAKKAAREAAEEEAAAKAAAAGGDAPEGGDGEADDEEGKANQPDPAAISSSQLVDDFEVEFLVPTPPPKTSQSIAREDGEDGEEGEGRQAAAETEEAAEGGEEAPPEEDDEEDETLTALKEKVAFMEKVLQLVVKPFVPAPPVDEEGNPVEPPKEVSPWRGRPYGEKSDVPLQHTEATDTEKEEPSKDAPPRLKPAALAAVVRWRLSQRDCRCQGYVLDGYPKTVKDAATVFAVGEATLPEQDEPEPEEEDATALMAAVDEKLFPDMVTIFEGNEEVTLKRAVAGTADALGRYYRRLKQYKAAVVDNKPPHKSLVRWFSAILTNKETAPREITSLFVDFSDEDLEKELKTVRDAIGAPHFYRPTPADIVREAKDKQLEEERLLLAHLKAEEEALRVAAEAEARRKHEAAMHERRYRSIQEEQAAAELIQGMPMQTYLLQFVVPTLTRGIAHCVNLRPEDPVDTLADYLFDFKAKRTL